MRYFTAWDPSYGIPPRGKNWTKNPQFPFHLKNKTSIAVLLQQPDPRSVEENRPPFKKTTLLAVVFKLEQSEKAISVFQPDKIAIQSQGSDSRCVVASGELKPGKYSVILMNSSEGTCSDCYLSIYFSCTKDEIVLENKNWEVILEEEEVGQRNRPSKLDVGKSLASNAINESKEHKNMIKQAMLPNNLQSMVKVKTDDIINPIGKKLVDGVIGQEKKRRSQEETKHLAFGKSASKPVTDLSEKLPTRSTTSYTQGIKELKKTIQNIEVEDDLDNKISNPLDAEIEFERDMAMLLGLDYQDYKTFHTLPTEQQEKIIEEYQDITTQNSTVLDLNYYGLTNKGLNAVLEGIEDFPNLEYLYLRENKLGDISVCDLCRRLELSRQQGIKEIDLGYNENLTDNSGLALVALASRIKSIEKISVDNTEITTKIQQKISEVTERNKKLKNS